jgi:hypothetical protein
MSKEQSEGAKPSKPADKEDKSKTTKDEKSEKVQENKSDSKDTQGTAQENKQSIIPPSDINVKEIINKMARISDPIKNIYAELEDEKTKLADLEGTKLSAQKLVKPLKRLDKNQGAKKKIEDSDERKLLKTQKNFLDWDLILQRERVDRLQEEFTRLCGNERKALKYRKLQSKAESKKYVRENKTFLLSKAKKILDDSLHIYKNSYLDLKTKAQNDTEEGVGIFNASLRELFFMVDEEGAILCSGIASKTKIYAAVRVALLVWDAETEAIPDLVWPIDEKKKKE